MRTFAHRPDPADVEARIRRCHAEMLDQALYFPAIYRTYLEYRDRNVDASGLRRLQGERLGALLTYATSQVPAFRELDVDQDEVRVDPWAALARFPLVTKAELRDRMVEHCDDEIDPANCRAVETSGTTGQPLRVVHDMRHLAHTQALALLRNERLNQGFHRKLLHPLHTSLDRWFEFTSPAQGFARVAQFGASGDDAYWTDILARVRGFRPDAVIGHPTLVLELCDLLGTAGEVRPGLVYTWGERLTAGMAKRLSDFFEAPVCDAYGLREVSVVAVQCRYGQYHIECERLWVEVVDPHGAAVPDGEAGELVVTNLINQAMPLIRYRTGDIGALAVAPECCACGMPHRTLTLLEGREPGAIVLPGGRRASTMVLFRMLSALPVERYQVVQSAPDGVDLIVKPLPAFTAATAESLRDRAERALGGALRVSVRSDGAFLQQGERKAVDFVSLLERRAAPDNSGETT